MKWIDRFDRDVPNWIKATIALACLLGTMALEILYPAPPGM